MTRLYAGWAPGEALNFGWQLGVTASHSDLLDYRAMLARVRHLDGPQVLVEKELRMGCSIREHEERIAAKFGILV